MRMRIRVWDNINNVQQFEDITAPVGMREALEKCVKLALDPAIVSVMLYLPEKSEVGHRVAVITGAAAFRATVS